MRVQEKCRQLGVLKVLLGIVVMRVLLNRVVVKLVEAVYIALPEFSGPFSNVATLVNVQNVLAGAG